MMSLIRKNLSPLKPLVNFLIKKILKLQRLRAIRDYRSVNEYRDEVLKNCDVIFDIGSCSGEYISQIQDLKTKTVFSFEPDKLIFAQLKKSLKKFKNIRFYNFAIASSENYKELNFYAIPALNSFNLIKQSLQNTTKFIEKRKVECQSLDNFVISHNINSIDLLNVDTNGSELSILEGAKKLLSTGKVKNIEICLLSPNIYNLAVNNLSKILSTLDHHNFVLDQIFFEPIDFKITKYYFMFSLK